MQRFAAVAEIPGEKLNDPGLQHTFKAPLAEPRASLLGLDRLAAEKRAASAGESSSSTGEQTSKRQRLEKESDEVVDRNSGGVFKVPALPIRKDNIRQRVPETPTHTGGLPTAAREALAARLKARNMPTNLAVGGTLALSANTKELRDSRPGDRGLGEFARRGNRGLNREERTYDRDNRDHRRQDHRGQDHRDPARPKSWNDAPTPRTNRTDRDMDGGSMRVPNRGWDETPRTSSRGGPSRAWDAPTPRRGRNGSPTADGEDGMHLDAKEWEEEQVRLDRDWYSTYDEGAVVSVTEVPSNEAGDLTVFPSPGRR